MAKGICHMKYLVLLFSYGSDLDHSNNDLGITETSDPRFKMYYTMKEVMVISESSSLLLLFFLLGDKENPPIIVLKLSS